MIGEEHSCAKINDWNEREQIVIASKKMDKEPRQIVSIINRITEQLAELSLSFKKFQNTRVIYLEKGDMTLSFYYHEQHFYAITFFTCLEIIQISKVIRDIIHDTEMPLYRCIPKISEEILLASKFP